MDMIFAMRQDQEKYIKQNKTPYSVFIDLTKAFDTVNMKALWITPEVTCETDSATPRQNDRQVLYNGNTSAAFAVSNGVKQDCLLAPVLCNLLVCCHVLSRVRRREYTPGTDWTALFELCHLDGDEEPPDSHSFMEPSLPMTAFSWCIKIVIYS